MSSEAREKSANENFEIQHTWISLTIQLNMSLLQQYFAWDFSKNVQVRDWSHSRPQSLNQDSLKQLSIRLENILLGSSDQAFYQKSLPSFSTSIRESNILMFC